MGTPPLPQGTEGADSSQQTREGGCPQGREAFSEAQAVCGAEPGRDTEAQ